MTRSSCRAPLAVAFLLVASFPCGVGASMSGAPPPPRFWDRHVAYGRLLETRPDSALAIARSLVARDRDDLLGRWLVAQWAAAHDTLSRAARLAAADSFPDRPGEQVEAGTMLMAVSQTERGRAAFERASVAYAAAHRPLDACRATLWRVVRRKDRRDRPTIAADLDRAESAARAHADPEMLADVLMVRADFEVSQDVRPALKRRREALDLLLPLGPSLQLAECHRDLATALKTGGDFGEAETHVREAMRLASTFGDMSQMHQALAQLGDLHRARGEYPQADSVYKAALLVAQHDGDSTRMAQRHVDLGDLNKEIGRFAEARAHYEESLRLRAAIGAEGNEQVSLLDGLGSIAALDGDYDLARRRFEEALTICRQRGLKRQSAIVWLHLAAVHRDLGDPLQATALAERGLSAARESGHRRAELMLLSFRGRARDDGRLDSALATSRQAAALAREVEPRNLPSILRDEALTLTLLGRNREAIATMDSAVALAPDSSDLSRSLQLQGSIRLEMREPGAAIDLLTRSFAIADAMRSPERQADVRLLLGAAQLAAGRPREAIATLESGLVWFERTRSLVRSSEERSGWQALYNDGFYSLAVAYARTRQNDAAFATLERARARELRALMDVRTRGLRGRVQPVLARSIERVEGDLAVLQSSLLREYARPAAERSRDLVRMEARADSLKLRWSDLNRRIESETPGLTRGGGLPAALTAAQVQRLLQPGERLVVFTVGHAGSLRFDFGPGGLVVRELPWGERDVALRVEALNAVLRGGRPDEWEVASAACADTLFGGDVMTSPPERLFIVPDAALHYLPFEALRPSTGPGQARRTLIESSEVTYGSSVTLLMSPRGPRRPVKAHDAPIVAFGDPAVSDTSGPADRSRERGGLQAVGSLPHARREVLALQKLYPGARVYLGADATESRFLTEAVRAPIVHVAAHAFVDDRYPKFSGIVLAPTNGDRGKSDDGLLQAFEVLDGSFDLQLATLSACESGRGALRRGEGLTGLARAFQLAGARQLLVSLWKVDDAATADLMTEFYTRLSSGEAPATALRSAKLAFIRGTASSGNAGGGGTRGDADAEVASDGSRGVGAHRRIESRAQPAAWAPFVLIGDRGR